MYYIYEYKKFCDDKVLKYEEHGKPIFSLEISTSRMKIDYLDDTRKIEIKNKIFIQNSEIHIESILTSNGLTAIYVRIDKNEFSFKATYDGPLSSLSIGSPLVIPNSVNPSESTIIFPTHNFAFIEDKEVVSLESFLSSILSGFKSLM